MGVELVFGLALLFPMRARADEDDDDRDEDDLAVSEVDVIPFAEGFECVDPIEDPTLTLDRLADGTVTPILHLPGEVGAQTWRLDIVVSRRSDRLRLSVEVVGTVAELAVPAEAFEPETDKDWLSSVSVTAIGLDKGGQVVLRVAVEPVWLVWPSGDALRPVWVDSATRALVAPNGAWSDAAWEAIAAGASPEEAGDPTVELWPGGAK